MLSVTAPPPADLTPSAIIRRARADGLRPDAQIGVSEWADAKRRLPKKSSAEPGPWRTARTPYLREIQDCFSSTSDVEEIIFMKGAQVGGTEAILNALGYDIDHAPGPTIFVQPTVELAKRFSKQRVDPLLTLTLSLAQKIAPTRDRDSGNTMLSKDYPGGQLVITGANSAVGLRSMPAQYAFMDEIDGYPIDVDEEGSPIELVKVRQRTFARKKRALVSTPTIAGRSAIEAAYATSDRRRYYVPCPDCGHMQPLEFKQLTWSKLGLKPSEAVYECRECSFPIQNHQKTEMLAKGEWRAEAEEPSGKVRGYHLNALYSPVGWVSWGEIATNFVKVHKDPEKYRVFVNTVLGDVWAAKGDAPEWEALYRRRLTYELGSLPNGVLFLTCGVDVQKDRVVYEVVGWGRGKRSWSIDYGEIAGDTADLHKGPWPQLAELLERSFPHESGAEMSIRVMAVDSGYNTQTVYQWTRRYPLSRVIAVKGRDHGGVLIGSPSTVDVRRNGQMVRNGARVWPVAVSIAKSELYGWLRLESPQDGSTPAPGYCEFPQYHDEYFKQLTSEQLVVTKTRRGFIRLAWEMSPGRQNHVLDARIYARAAASVAGLDRMKDSDFTAREQQLPQKPSQQDTPAAPAAQSEAKPPSTPNPWNRPRKDWFKKGDR